MDELRHYGVKGMRWGVRRFQNKDGTLTKRGERHKKAAIKGLEDEISKMPSRIESYKTFAKVNKQALDASIKDDKKTGEKNSWRTQMIMDSYKSAGRAYVNEMAHYEVYKKYLKAYNNDTIKVGEDYITKFGRRYGEVVLTESGRAKEGEIYNKVSSDFKKKHSADIKRYT